MVCPLNQHIFAYIQPAQRVALHHASYKKLLGDGARCSLQLCPGTLSMDFTNLNDSEFYVRKSKRDEELIALVQSQLPPSEVARESQEKP